jgi:hypothetical protein
MTIKELIAELKEYPEDMQIALSIDPEGNTIKQLYEVAEYSKDLVVLWPNDTIIEEDEEDEDWFY